jgi:hypothetical protein
MMASIYSYRFHTLIVQHRNPNYTYNTSSFRIALKYVLYVVVTNVSLFSLARSVVVLGIHNLYI